MERITENVRQRLMEAVEECDRVLEEGDAHDLMEAVDLARGSMLAAHELILSLPTGTLDYIKWLEAENEQRVPRWISVEERLPEHWHMDDKDRTLINYLVYSPDYGVDVGNYIKSAKRWVCMGLPMNVTHWMPLPEPPEEVNSHEAPRP